MATYTYVETVNDNLLCCICRMPFVEPLTTNSCSHTFCRECISTALHLSRHCPIDRSPLTLDDLSPADPLLRNLVDELQVECSMKSAGCSYTGQRQLLDSHLREDCQYVSVSCLDGLCDSIVPRNTAKHSDHTNGDRAQDPETASESSKFSECGGCHSQLSDTALPAHKDSCPDVSVECEQASHGCEWNGPRRELADHLKACSYQAIKGFFAIQDRKTTALSEENAALRHKINAMDGLITSLRRELSSVKAALGPWYRPDRHAVANSDASHPTGAVRSLSANGNSSGSAHSAGFAGSPGVQAQSSVLSGSLAHSDDLASYFPEPEPDDWLPADYRSSYETSLRPLAHHSNMSSSQTASHQTVQSPPVNRTTMLPHAPYTQTQPSAYTIPTPASPSQSPVAPLDISTSLEGSLLGLRESIVSLSGALDSLNRRQDVALTAESMRTAEEIRSLRAIIHGLRMQVHSIIMDRNAQVTGHSADESMLPWLPDPHEGSPMPWMRVPFAPRYPLASMSSTPGSAPKL